MRNPVSCVLLLLIACSMGIPAVTTGQCDCAGFAATIPVQEVFSGPATGISEEDLSPDFHYAIPTRSFHFYRETITEGTSRHWIDLSWSNFCNPYSLTIFAPNAVLGPFTNAANGRQDGRIFLEISTNSNLTAGDWYYQVQAEETCPCNQHLLLTYENTRAEGAG